MPRGPKGEKRPADVVGCAITVAKIATGEIEDSQDESQVPGRRKSGEAGGRARARKLSADERSRIAKLAAESRWAASARQNNDGE